MYSTRKVKTKSDSTAIQVVQYIGHRSKIAKHIGSAKDYASGFGKLHFKTSQTMPMLVAEAAMPDEKRLTELRQKKISYIEGARLANARLSLVKQNNSILNGVHGTNARFESKHGCLVCDFSQKRY